MPELELFIGNKNYSSWSFRPWFALIHKKIPFTEHLVPFDFKNGNPDFAAFSPSGKVPVLKNGDLTVWDSFAILEFTAELYPEAGLWPEDREVRATARAVAAEMHSGFSALRSACPMNMRRPAGTLDVTEAVKADVARIVDLWTGCLTRSEGPFLFGDVTIADAMFAPVVSRFATYELSRDPVYLRYHAAMTATDAWQHWQDEASKEPWIVEEEEI